LILQPNRSDVKIGLARAHEKSQLERTPSHTATHVDDETKANRLQRCVRFGGLEFKFHSFRRRGTLIAFFVYKNQ